jgi:hypothetical protein
MANSLLTVDMSIFCLGRYVISHAGSTWEGLLDRALQYLDIRVWVLWTLLTRAPGTSKSNVLCKWMYLS